VAIHKLALPDARFSFLEFDLYAFAMLLTLRKFAKIERLFEIPDHALV
jgi:hypothetical protein